jgi:regulator of nucleoside diphosphate kinase
LSARVLARADAARGWVSVLAPLGSALIGLRVGQEIDWPMPRGVRRIRIVAVLSPPAADAPAP